MDCRTNPFSRYNPEFSKFTLEPKLKELGIKYVHAGHLGGKQKYGINYENELNELEKSSKKKGDGIALMCSELDPRKCHRYKKIGEDLAQKGLYIIHIDKDDSDWEHPITAKKAPKKTLILHR